MVTRADQTIEQAVDGVRHPGLPDLVTPEDRFHIGSNAKAMTATMIAILVEEKRIQWDTKIADVFPE